MVGVDKLRVFARLNTDPDFQVFMDELKRCREASRDAFELVTCPYEVGRHQGRSLLANELITLVQGARDALAKHETLTQRIAR